MNWYLQSNRDSDVVVSTRIRYARNFRNYKFNVKDEKEAKEIEKTIRENLSKLD